jgi:Bacterial TSP3 repeat/PKD domain
MFTRVLRLLAAFCLFGAWHASAAVLYVDINSTNPVSPFSSWATAATNIQDAVNAASSYDEVLVTNGVYAFGGDNLAGNSRVDVTKPLTLESVNGPGLTIIRGTYALDGSGTRCVTLSDGDLLVGFTLTQGSIWITSRGPPPNIDTGGGVFGWHGNSTVSNCVITGNASFNVGGGAGCETLDGPATMTLYNCTLSSNIYEYEGGGAYGCTLYNCAVFDNSLGEMGGGAYNCALYGCSIASNLASGSGGGVYGCTLNDCTLTGNSAGSSGGGAYQGSLNGCSLSGNSASSYGGGAYSGILNNCTLVGNSAGVSGAGAQSCTLNNCIVYFNSAPTDTNYSGSTLNYCCTTPMPTGGSGNIVLDPMLADFLHISAGSPCLGAGSAAFSTGVDIDGESWANPPSIGCDEYYTGLITGPLSVAIQAPYTSLLTNSPLNLVGLFGGHAAANRWDFGDGAIVSNRPLVSHSWSAIGDYSVVLTTFNDDNLAGISASMTVHVLPKLVFYVSATSTNPVPPYTSWADAAMNIQDAASISAPGGLVLVTNGVYASGGRAVYGSLMNRLAVTQAIAVQSVNGPGVTTIQGYQVPGTTLGDSAVRCVYLTNGATLAGFTLTNGATRSTGFGQEQEGGGVFCDGADAVVSNCVVIGNTAYSGGGALAGIFDNCLLVQNSAIAVGGGAYGCTLNNCTLTENSCPNCGAGARECTLDNCISYYNLGDNYCGGSLDHCCTTPLPAGSGNITSEPLFIGQAVGNLRLQSNSPCINAGNNANAPAGTDLDGRPRIVGGTVDIGAYEYMGPFNAWLQQYGLATNGAADFIDTDGDGLNNYQEYIAGTNPTNPASVLQMLSPASTNDPPGLVVSWQSVANVTYYLQRATSLSVQPAFQPLATNLPGQAGTTSYLDTNAPAPGPYFYRVGVQQP